VKLVGLNKTIKMPRSNPMAGLERGIFVVIDGWIKIEKGPCQRVLLVKLARCGLYLSQKWGGGIGDN
jgi:hypothetical protein